MKRDISDATLPPRKTACLIVLLSGIVVGPVASLEAFPSAPTTHGQAAMDEDWDFYLLRVDNEPASIYLNLALAQIAPIKTEPNMAYVRVRMQRPRQDGLSSSDEFQALSDLEDILIGGIARNGTTTYAGRNTSSGNRDFYFYTTDLVTFSKSVKSAMSAMPSYQFEIGGRSDPGWKVYSSFLYPSADDLQRILNRRLNDHLTSQGDDISKSRIIDHVAYLPSDKSAETLRDYLKLQGFSVGAPKLGGSSIGLNFERTDAPAQIDDVVIPIAQRIRDLGGDYDGWGCEVTK
jgi:hypothetical protein